jgi:hypothetical protein
MYVYYRQSISILPSFIDVHCFHTPTLFLRKSRVGVDTRESVQEGDLAVWRIGMGSARGGKRGCFSFLKKGNCEWTRSTNRISKEQENSIFAFNLEWG